MPMCNDIYSALTKLFFLMSDLASVYIFMFQVKISSCCVVLEYLQVNVLISLI